MKLLDALFCDDIRHEASNKVSLMGLYNDRIVIHLDNSMEAKWPLPINLSTLLRFSIEENEKQPVRFEFEYILNEKTIVKIEGGVNLDNANKVFTIALTGSGIPLEPGDLGFSIKIFHSNQICLTEMNKTALKIIAMEIKEKRKLI